MSNNNSNDDSDFQARAAATASKISQSALNPAEILAQSLTSDQPKIDSAVKSYMSLCAARSLTTTETDISSTDTSPSSCCYFSSSSDPRMASLKCARSLLKAINSLTIPPDEEEKDDSKKEEEVENDVTKLERNVVRIVWNGLVKNGNKPSKILGKRSLSYAYPYILKLVTAAASSTDDTQDSKVSAHTHADVLPVDVERNESILFFREFGNLLPEQHQQPPNSDSDKDNDSALLWDIDGGKAELARRRDRRVKRGKAAVTTDAQRETLKQQVTNCFQHSNTDASTVTIEEITEDEDGEN
mmetsp:Transcript_32571/g.48559  ORF Transcript_32571/g.48559 Transcript_32571/m.48559 type:complete len:300 (-) Transcript_32571:758-1657(-)